MKTPRELILERHQSAEAKLKAIRAEDLAACTRSAAAGERRNAQPSIEPRDHRPAILAGNALALAPGLDRRGGQLARHPGLQPGHR